MIKAVIFDMDGVIVDNGKFHKKAWREFVQEYGIKISQQKWDRKLFGRTNEFIMPYVFGKKFSKKELKKLAEEKELHYRKIYSKHIKPVKGLLKFLKELKKNKIKISIGTSAPKSNVEFVLGKTKTRKFFEKIVDDSMVKKCKPNPEIYLTAAQKLSVKPKECIVFEDSFSGIRAGNSAKMHVIGLTTSHKKSQLKNVKLAINDFTELKIKEILKW
ncbi:MAG: HAD family phosphatase [Candidatus Diapherotrites archaeon]|nr:HAD family phosphatase [Candidatus Diapherotrites archaeon]